MEGLLFGLNFILFIWFIVGLFKPATALWIKEPTRLKVFGIWVIGLFVIGGLSAVLIDKDTDNYKLGQEYFVEKNYEKAIETLKRVSRKHENYSDIQRQISKADSLRASEEKLKQEEKERENISRQIEERDRFKNQLLRELDSDIIKTGNTSVYRGDLKSLQTELIVFGAWKILIDQADKDPNPEVQKLGKQLKKKVVALQIREFPILRREYAKFAKGVLWEHDCDVNLGGSKNTTIEFVATAFAANKNIKNSYETLYEQMKMFRFKRVQYKWSKYDDEYTYYTMPTPADDQLYSPDE
jgi:hypothetical protein